jgi:hypothetical protein
MTKTNNRRVDADVRKRKPNRKRKDDIDEFVGSPIESVFIRPIMLHVCKDGTVTYRDRTKREPVFNGRALPVFSVDTITEAKQIQVRFCSAQYTSHPLMPGRTWYVVSPLIFSGEVEDLDRVTVEFAKFWAEYIKGTREAKAWAYRLWKQFTKHKQLTLGADE